jgi:CheY-like chemotaxis protein
MRPAPQKCSQDGAKAVESAAFATSGTTPGRRILLADDSEDIRALVAAYLEHTPHHVEIAADGQAAVEKFCAGHFDLVLMDIQMPVMDGYAAARAIRQWEAERGVARSTILALTGGAWEEDAQDIGEPVCDAQLSKPFRMQTFLAAIEEHLHARDVVRVSLSPGIERLVPEYLEGRKAEVGILESALAGDDYETIRVLGHHLKGSGTPYGFAALSQIGKGLESAAGNRSPEEVRRQIAALGDYLARVKVTA